MATLFAQPVEVPTTTIGLLWALPISLTISMVYKAIKLPSWQTKLYLREVALLFITIVGFLILVAVVLAVISHLISL